MAKPRMTVRPGSRSAATEKKPKRKPAHPWRRRKLLLWCAALLGLGVMLFCIFVFNIFESSTQDFTHYVPANVDFFFLKKDLAEDLDEDYAPLFLPRLKETSFWASLKGSNDYESLCSDGQFFLDGGIDAMLARAVPGMGEVPIDIIHNAVGMEIAFAGRVREDLAEGAGGSQTAIGDFLTQTRFALYLRIRWKVKLAYRLMRSSIFSGMFSNGFTVRPEEDHVVLENVYAGRDLLLWRERDMLVLSNDREYLGEIKDLVAKEGVTQKSFYADSREYDRMLKEHEDSREDDSEAYWIIRPEGVLGGLGIEDPVPLPREDKRSTLAGRFLGQIVSSKLIDRIVGYSRASTDPLGIDRDLAGVRIRGQVQLRDMRRQKARARDDSIDSEQEIEEDRSRFFTLKLDESLSVPPVGDGKEKSIDLYAGLVPEDVAVWAYLAGDLKGLFHMFERSLAPKDKPGEDWDRAEINHLFVQAIAGGDGFIGYNRRVGHERSRRLKEIPAEAMGLARQDAERLKKLNDAQWIQRRAERHELVLKRELPTSIVLDGPDGDHGLRKLLDRLAELFGEEDGGRGMFILRRNDYGDLRKTQQASDGSIQIPDSYKPDDKSPAWAFVFWIEGCPPKKAKDTVKLFFQELRFSSDSEDRARAIEVNIKSVEAGETFLREYWHPSIPGPGEIVTSLVKFFDEEDVNKRLAASSRRSARASLPKDVYLFVLSNHVLLAQDILKSGLNTAADRAGWRDRRLNQNATFQSMLRQELSAQRRISTFVYFNGVELGKIQADMTLDDEALQIAALNELDDARVQRELFREAANLLGLGSYYADGIPLDALWKRIPAAMEQRMDQKMAELRGMKERSLLPELKQRMTMRANYPALTPRGMFSLQTASSKPLKVDFQLFTLIDLKPAQ